jgi:crotonobetainyl-CoA:carnitine CoA-transferase CaiB-like acyl-CoA transferase
MGHAPLEGTRIVDLARNVAGTTIGRVLADFGATVIRVESSTQVDTARRAGPYIDGVADRERSLIYGNSNAGKLGISVDLSTERGRDLIHELADSADVLIESFSPGVMERWHLHYEALQTTNPLIVMLSTSLMGHTGPLASIGGYGNVGSALSGFQYIVGWPDQGFFGPFGPYTDALAPRFALVLLLSALDNRRRIGRGCYIDHSQVESAIHFLSPELADFFVGGHVVERRGNDDAEMSPHGVFECQPSEGVESHWVAIAVQSDEAWRELVDLMGAPDLLDGRYMTAAERLVARELLNGRVARWAQSHTAIEVESMLQSRGIAAYRAISDRDAIEDPQLVARGHFVRLPHPLADWTVVEAPKYELSVTPGRPRTAAPLIGQHNRYVLGTLLEYSEAEIAELVDSGVLK